MDILAPIRLEVMRKIHTNYHQSTILTLRKLSFQLMFASKMLPILRKPRFPVKSNSPNLRGRPVADSSDVC